MKGKGWGIGERGNKYKMLPEKLKGRCHLGDLDVDGEMP
jgi:hypothetical protein